MNCYGYETSCHSVSGARRFLTKEEKVQLLKAYKESLELEAKGVGERITELEKEQDSDEE